MKQLSATVELIPHVSIDPNDYRKSKKRSQHKIKGREKLAYWEQSFHEAGIDGIKPLGPNWWAGAVRDIHHKPIYRRLLAKAWHKLIKSDDSKEALLACLEGGYR